MIDTVRSRAAELLKSGEVSVVVGYREGRRRELAVPHFVRDVADVDALVLDPFCSGGLAVFATREAVSQGAAFVATPQDIRSLRVLVQEGQITSENVRIIGFACQAPGNPAGEIRLLEGSRLEDFDNVIECAADNNIAAEVARIMAMPPEERWRFWRAEFDKCVRCYACRAACPMCYCAECIADRNLPQWIETTARPRGNFAWNLIRAWHLAGRCTLCGACERACSEGIKLTLLNAMLAAEVRDAFDYVAGFGCADEAGVFASFKDSDKEEFLIDG